jgi:repressor LexA
MRKLLTERQATVLAHVRDHIDTHGYPPTVREICDRFGWSSTQAAHDHLAALARKGYLERVPNIARGLRLLPAHEPARESSPTLAPTREVLP